MPVLDAQHLRTIGVVAAGLAPEIGELQRRHQQFDRPGPVHLLADDLRDLLQDAEAERQPGIDAGRLLPDHAGAQHQPVRDDLGLFRSFAENRQEITGKTHKGGTCELEKLMRRNSLRRRPKQSQRAAKGNFAGWAPGGSRVNEAAGLLFRRLAQCRRELEEAGDHLGQMIDRGTAGLAAAQHEFEIG